MLLSLSHLRAIFPASRRLLQHPARGTPAWVVPPVAALLVAVAAFLSNVHDRAHAEHLAAAELRARLDTGEHLLHETDASQRHWYDLYRATYGVLAATDRRVLFVGVTPELYATAEDPRVFDVRSFPYDTTFAIAFAGVPLNTRTVAVAAGGRADRFAVSRRAPEVRALVATAAQRASAIADALRREQRYYDSIAALPPNRDYYRVRRGDALDAIAKRYGTTADHIRELNALAGDRIVVGQELLVREMPRPIPPCPARICGIITASGGEVEPPPPYTPSPTPRAASVAPRPAPAVP